MNRKLTSACLFCVALGALSGVLTLSPKASADDPFGHPGLSWDQVDGGSWCGKQKQGEDA